MWFWDPGVHSPCQSGKQLLVQRMGITTYSLICQHMVGGGFHKDIFSKRTRIEVQLPIVSRSNEKTVTDAAFLL